MIICICQKNFLNYNFHFKFNNKAIIIFFNYPIIIIETALVKNPKARIAVNAIALETLQETQRLFAEFGLQQVEITQLSAARGKSIGCYTMMTANNPVFILSGKGDKYGE